MRIIATIVETGRSPSTALVAAFSAVFVVVSSLGCDPPTSSVPFGVQRLGWLAADVARPRGSVDNVSRPLLPSATLSVDLDGAPDSYLEFEVAGRSDDASLPTALLQTPREQLKLDVEPGNPPIDASRAWRRLRANLPEVEGRYELHIETELLVSLPRVVRRDPKLPPWNVLWIVLDTARADYLGCYGGPSGVSPNIDALAREGVLFERATSQASWTLPAMASMLTGLYPESHGVIHTERRLPATAVTFVERFAASGFATGAVVSGTFTDSYWGMDQGFDYYDDLGMVVDTDLEAMHRGAHRRITSPLVTDRASAWLDSKIGQRFFLMTHYFDPHQDYLEHGGSGQPIAPLPCASPRLCRTDPDPQETARLRTAYAGEIAFTDRHIGRLLDHLASRDLLQHTVVLLTADHGEEFYERNYLGHGNTLFNELIRVPLLVVAPGDATPAGRRVTTPVATLDIGATLLDLVGLDGDEFGQGRSLVPLLREDGPLVDRAVFSSLHASLAPAPGLSGPLLAYRVDRGEYSLVSDTRMPTLLYDWSADETQTLNLAEQRSEIVSSLAGQYRETEQRFLALQLSREGLELANGLRDKLRALGYGAGGN